MKKENIKSIIIITLLIIFSLSATYAFLILGVSNNTATGIGGCFKVNYSGQTINNSSLISTSDYNEGASSDIILSKSSDCQIYTKASIMINTATTTTAPISNGALKYKVLNGENIISEGAITATGDTTLTTVTLTNTATTYKVYIWIDSSISQGTYNNKSYSGYLYASAIQTSEIK